MIKLEKDRYGNEGWVVRAAKTHYCDGYRHGFAAIRAGEFYYRAIAFPGTEANESGNTPWVMKICRACLNEPIAERFDAAVATLLPSVLRDNGTVYTPRALRPIVMGSEDDDPDAIVVIGTHDFDRARPVAAARAHALWVEWGYDAEHYPNLGDARASWFRRDILSWDDIDGPRYTFTLDREHGVAVVQFEIEWRDAPTNLTDTPLEGVQL